MSSNRPQPTLGERVKDKLSRLAKQQIGRVRWRLQPPSLPSSEDGRLRLHLGCGPVDAPGFINIDLLEAPHIHLRRPLDDLSVFPDGSVALVYACHCLEHFGYRHSRLVLQEWTRVLEPGGVLRLAVPDFAVLARAYANGAPLGDIEGLMLGGQDYRLNFHAAVFDERVLTDLMSTVGLVHVRRWDPATADHHGFSDESTSSFLAGGERIPLSLNLEANKPGGIGKI